MKNKHFSLKILLICLAIVFSIAFLSSSFNIGATSSSWYLQNKPSITPPSYVFPIVWSILYFLIALSLYFVWQNSSKKQKFPIVIIFGLNLILNGLWSYLFFSLQNPFASFIDLIFIWLTIISMLIYSYKIDKKASYLLIPYFLWVSFAGYLNYLFL